MNRTIVVRALRRWLQAVAGVKGAPITTGLAAGDGFQGNAGDDRVTAAAPTPSGSGATGSTRMSKPWWGTRPRRRYEPAGTRLHGHNVTAHGVILEITGWR